MDCVQCVVHGFESRVGGEWLVHCLLHHVRRPSTEVGDIVSIALIFVFFGFYDIAVSGASLGGSAP